MWQRWIPPIPEVTGGIDAFALGVYSVKPEAKIYVKVTNSWFDPDAEKAAAQTLLNMDCDVVTQHCDTEYPQTMAQEKGVYGIGYNSDMSKNAPDACLCQRDLELGCLLYSSGAERD